MALQETTNTTRTWRRESVFIWFANLPNKLFQSYTWLQSCWPYLCLNSELFLCQLQRSGSLNLDLCSTSQFATPGKFYRPISGGLGDFFFILCTREGEQVCFFYVCEWRSFLLELNLHLKSCIFKQFQCACCICWSWWRQISSGVFGISFGLIFNFQVSQYE